jgi:hypothetical protein
MVWRQMLPGTLLLAMLAGSAPAGIFFNRGKPQDSARENKPADRASELIRALRMEPDERRRQQLVDELARFDLRQYPQVAPALIESLQRDQSAGVRAAAAEALGNLRPMTTQAGRALELALNGDASVRVHAAARNSLSAYFHAGYRPAGAGTPLPSPPAQSATTTARTQSRPSMAQTAEPPLATSNPGSAKPPAQSRTATSRPQQNAGRAPGFLTPNLSEKASALNPPAEPNQTRQIPALDVARPKESRPAAKPAKPDNDGPILNPNG